MPRFSSKKLSSLISLLGLVSANALRREDGQSKWRLTALTNEATELKVVGLEEDEDQRKECETWPGMRMPSMHKLTQVEGRFGKGAPQSSCRLLT
jgi:hypothetical protein